MRDSRRHVKVTSLIIACCSAEPVPDTICASTPDAFIDAGKTGLESGKGKAAV